MPPQGLRYRTGCTAADEGVEDCCGNRPQVHTPQVGCQPVVSVLLSIHRIVVLTPRLADSLGGLRGTYSNHRSVASPWFRSVHSRLLHFHQTHVAYSSIGSIDFFNLGVYVYQAELAFHHTFPRCATLGTDAAFRRSRKDTPPGQFVWIGRKVSVRPALRGNRPDVPCVGSGWQSMSITQRSAAMEGSMSASPSVPPIRLRLPDPETVLHAASGI